MYFRVSKPSHSNYPPDEMESIICRWLCLIQRTLLYFTAKHTIYPPSSNHPDFNKQYYTCWYTKSFSVSSGGNLLFFRLRRFTTLYVTAPTLKFPFFSSPAVATTIPSMFFHDRTFPRMMLVATMIETRLNVLAIEYESDEKRYIAYASHTSHSRTE